MLSRECAGLRATSRPSGSVSGTRNTTSRVPTYPQVKYHLGFAVADKFIGVLRVKNDIILKLKGENHINTKLSNAFWLFFHAKHLLLSKTHFTTCTELKTEAKFPVKPQSCALSIVSGDTGRAMGFSCHEPWPVPGLRWRTSHQGPLHGPWLSGSRGGVVMTPRCSAGTGCDPASRLQPASTSSPVLGGGRGVQEGAGEDRAAQSSPVILLCTTRPWSLTW